MKAQEQSQQTEANTSPAFGQNSVGFPAVTSFPGAASAPLQRKTSPAANSQVIQLWKSPTLNRETVDYTDSARSKDTMARYWELRGLARLSWLDVEENHGSSGDSMELGDVLEHLPAEDQEEYRKLDTWYKFMSQTPGTGFMDLMRHYRDADWEPERRESFKIHHILSRSKMNTLLGAMSPDQQTLLSSDFRHGGEAEIDAGRIMKSLRSNLFFGPALRGDDADAGLDATYAYDSQAQAYQMDEVSQHYQAVLAIINEIDSHTEGDHMLAASFATVRAHLRAAEALRPDVDMDISKWQWHSGRSHWLKRS